MGPIAEVHYYVYGTDGVSLQVMESHDCLKSRGEKVYLCASDVLEADLPELDYHANAARELREAILDPGLSTGEDGLLGEIAVQSELIKGKLSEFLRRHRIRIVHLRNITSLPFLHLPATQAAHDLIVERQDLQFVLYHHDLNWEGPRAAKFMTGYRKIGQLAEEVMTPNLPNTTHVVINSLASEQLRIRKGIRAAVIPDGFNFEKKTIPIDEEAFLSDFGFRKDDLLVGMMARVRPHKAIQMALQFVHALEGRRDILEANTNGVGLMQKDFGPESRIFLVLSQSQDLDEEYFREINRMAKKMGVRLRFIGDRVVSDRRYTGQKGVYPFYSVYQPMDLIVHPSIHEGFGNQAVEAAWAKKPLVMHAYPVAEADILPRVTSVISLGNNRDLIKLGGTGMMILRDEVIQMAAQQAIEVLLNHDFERTLTQKAYHEFKELCDINKIIDRCYRIYQQWGR